MRKKLSVFLILTVAVLTVLLTNIQTNAQWQRDERKDRKQERSSSQARRDNRHERIIVRPSVRSNVRVIRPSVSSNYRVVRPNAQIYRTEAYSRSDRYYENNAYGNFVQVARINGYQDGLKEGSKDARHGNRLDPFGEGEYKDGDGGYRSSYGDKAAYRQFYRQAFLQGYREAFSSYLGGSRQINW
jgi:hypothetical protein